MGSVERDSVNGVSTTGVDNLLRATRNSVASTDRGGKVLQKSTIAGRRGRK